MTAAGRPTAQVISFRPDLFGPESVAKTERAEVTLGPEGKRRDSDLYVSLIGDARGRVTGRLIALRDITEHKRIEGELRAQRQLFADLVAVARATSDGPTLQATLQNALNVSATLTGAERGYRYSIIIFPSKVRLAVRPHRPTCWRHSSA